MHSIVAIVAVLIAGATLTSTVASALIQAAHRASVERRRARVAARQR